MEEQVYTRNAVTGWAVVIAFGLVLAAIYGVPGWNDIGKLLEHYNIAAIAGAAIALVGTPILGLAVGAWVRVVMRWVLGSPYPGKSREELVNYLEQDRATLARPPEYLMPPKGQRDRLFALLLYARAADPFTAFCRRQHTGRFLGYNCAAGWLIGAALAGLTRLAMYAPHWGKVVVAALLLTILIPLGHLLNGLGSARDVEHSERLWAWYLCHHPKAIEKGHDENRENRGQSPIS